MLKVFFICNFLNIGYKFLLMNGWIYVGVLVFRNLDMDLFCRIM